VALWSVDVGIRHVGFSLSLFLFLSSEYMCLYAYCERILFYFQKALSDLLKSITSLPADITLISLPAGPLLEIVCFATLRQLTAMWLSLASILIAQLNPPVLSLNAVKSGPTGEAVEVVRRLLPVLMECGMEVLGGEGYMEGVSCVFFF